jgi:hypothetical protein
LSGNIPERIVHLKKKKKKKEEEEQEEEEEEAKMIINTRLELQVILTSPLRKACGR